LTKAEEEFLEQYARSLSVRWADWCLRNGSLPDVDSFTQSEIDAWVSDHSSPLHPTLKALKELGIHKVYWDFAVENGWLTKKTPRTLTAKGFSIAVNFLKR
jgi:hypothetical protein